MPRAVLVQVKRQMLRFKFRQDFCFLDSLGFICVRSARRSLDESGFMVKMGSFVR
jgi:hypothetical protein